LKFLHEKGCPWNYRATHYATQRGHLDVLKFLHEKGCPNTLFLPGMGQ